MKISAIQSNVSPKSTIGIGSDNPNSSNKASLKYPKDTVSFSSRLLPHDKGLRKLKSEIAKFVAEKDVISILNHKNFGFGAEEAKDGKITLQNCNLKKCKYSFGDLHLDINEMFENVGVVKGDFIIAGNKSIKTLPSLNSVGGKVDCSRTTLESAGKFHYAGGNITFRDCKNLKDLGNLWGARGALDIRGCKKLKDLPKLEFLNFNKCLAKGSGLTDETKRIVDLRFEDALMK